MKTSPVILFFKSHIDTFTRKNGSVVNAHDDKRTKREADQKSGNGGKDWRDEENWHTRTQEKMKTHSEDQLRFIHKDATEAAETGEKSGFDSKKTGKYRDEAHYASMELKKRQDSAKSAPAKKIDVKAMHSLPEGWKLDNSGAETTIRDEKGGLKGSGADMPAALRSAGFIAWFNKLQG